MLEKRKISTLIPYKIKNGETFVFLEKRTKNRKSLPDYFGFWGGHAENNEDPEIAMLREIKEELDFIPKEYSHFGIYEFEKSIKNIYTVEVGDDFENSIHINTFEADYGKWFSENQVFHEEKLIENDKIVLRDFFKKFKSEL